MKLTLWQGFKLAGWLITSFLIGLMSVVYIIDYGDFNIDIIFYINKIFFIAIIWALLFSIKFILKKTDTMNKRNINKK
tara:strand:- start:13900 stop:14133 length:234 start_codon:yes stop_codon:yes gene_type:complete